MWNLLLGGGWSFFSFVELVFDLGAASLCFPMVGVSVVVGSVCCLFCLAGVCVVLPVVGVCLFPMGRCACCVGSVRGSFFCCVGVRFVVGLVRVLCSVG